MTDKELDDIDKMERVLFPNVTIRRLVNALRVDRATAAAMQLMAEKFGAQCDNAIELLTVVHENRIICVGCGSTQANCRICKALEFLGADHGG